MNKDLVYETIFLLVDINNNNFRGRHFKPLKPRSPINFVSWVSSYREGKLNHVDIDMLVRDSIELLFGSEEEIEEIKNIIIKLNNSLKKKDRIPTIVSLEEEMKKIQAKKYITIKEFAEIYNISVSSQQQFRGRLNDPLPYHQKVPRGKVVYVVEEVEKWFENQHK
jgi:hypothetical protein